MYAYSEVSPSVFNGAYSQVRMHRVAASVVCHLPGEGPGERDPGAQSCGATWTLALALGAGERMEPHPTEALRGERWRRGGDAFQPGAGASQGIWGLQLQTEHGLVMGLWPDPEGVQSLLLLYADADWS